MALVTTPGAADANSYATLAEFNAYAAVRLPVVQSVLDATDGEKEAALQAAARALDANFDWTGAAVDAVQALTWPRSGMATRNGFPIDDEGADSITKPLKDAQCEWAYQMLAGSNFIADNEAAKQGVASVRAGSVAVSFQSKDTSIDGSDTTIRLMGSEFNYVSLAVPGEVRRLLVPSWFEQPSIRRPMVLRSL